MNLLLSHEFAVLHEIYTSKVFIHLVARFKHFIPQSATVELFRTFFIEFMSFFKKNYVYSRRSI